MTPTGIRSPEGLGLGLDITSRVAALHRFDLRFSPSEHGGLQVDLEGPRDRPSGNDPPPVTGTERR